ncbi:MAG: tetratricopeptide repeat protein [Bacteroidales bacterium]|nr:tetratricopeptide repeat protein [Bacteroidales bacterium]MCF8454780.1 tetratricopeptide repeat protein [Bacteroidales bacterium]
MKYVTFMMLAFIANFLTLFVVIASNPTSQDSILSQADSLYKRYDLKHALPLYESQYCMLKSEKEKAHVQLKIGTCFYYTGKLKESLAYADSSTEFFKQVNDSVKLCEAYILAGSATSLLSRFEESVNFHLMALSIAKALNLASISDCYANLGTLKRNMGRYREALHYYRLGLAIDTEKGDSLYMGIGFNDIAGTYLYTKDYDSASYFFKIAYPILEKFQAMDNLAVMYNGFGLIAADKHQYDSALTYHQKAFEINKKLGRIDQTAVNLNNIGSMYSKQGKPDIANTYVLQALEINRKVGSLQLVRENYKSLASNHYALKQYKDAFDYTYAYNKLSDTLFQKDMNERIAKMQVEFETREKQDKIQLQELSIENYQNKLLRKKWQIGSLVILLLIVVLSVVLFFRQRNLTHKSERERLAQQIEKDEEINHLLNEKIEIQQREFLSNAVIIEKQSNLYDEIKQQLTTIDPNNGIENSIKKVVRLIDSKRDNHINVLIESYKKIKPGFLEKVKEHYPKITPNDLAYIPIFQQPLDNKKIAEVLGIEVKTVEQRNYRLRKKLNLEKSANLKEFFDAFYANIQEQSQTTVTHT